MRVVVELCYEHPEGHLKYSPQDMLREMVVEGNPALDRHPSADTWWEARGGALHHMGGGRWRLDAP